MATLPRDTLVDKITRIPTRRDTFVSHEIRYIAENIDVRAELAESSKAEANRTPLHQGDTTCIVHVDSFKNVICISSVLAYANVCTYQIWNLQLTQLINTIKHNERWACVTWNMSMMLLLPIVLQNYIYFLATRSTDCTRQRFFSRRICLHFLPRLRDS